MLERQRREQVGRRLRQQRSQPADLAPLPEAVRRQRDRAGEQRIEQARRRRRSRSMTAAHRAARGPERRAELALLRRADRGVKSSRCPGRTSRNAGSAEPRRLALQVRGDVQLLEHARGRRLVERRQQRRRRATASCRRPRTRADPARGRAPARETRGARAARAAHRPGDLAAADDRRRRSSCPCRRGARPPTSPAVRDCAGSRPTGAPPRMRTLRSSITTRRSAMARTTAGSSRCSSARMRARSDSSSSSSCTGTAAWAMIGPVSTPPSTKWTVQPVIFTPDVERLALGAHARERGQQGGVDVDDAAREGAQHLVAQHAHEPGQHDQIDLVRAQRRSSARDRSRRAPSSRGDRRRTSAARRRARAPARRSRERWSRRRRCAPGPARRGARDR